MSSDPKLAEEGRHRCDNCQKVWTADELKDFCDIMQRLDPGGTVPSGECPDCNCFCYPYEPKKRDVEFYVGHQEHRWITNIVPVREDEVDLNDLKAVESFALRRLHMQLEQANFSAAFFGLYYMGEIETDEEHVPGPPREVAGHSIALGDGAVASQPYEFCLRTRDFEVREIMTRKEYKVISDFLKRAVVRSREALEHIQLPLVLPEPPDVWGEDPDQPRSDWKYEVQNGDTNLGYWEWVQHRKEGG